MKPLKEHPCVSLRARLRRAKQSPDISWLKRLPFFLLAILFLWGCGAEVTISEDVPIIEPPPSNARSVGRVSAFGYATGGEHYTIVQALGDPLAEPVQLSSDGHYIMQ